MKINNNISAVITNKQLLGTENNLSSSMEKLSSGLKLNHASDNPSGMAISNKMKSADWIRHHKTLLTVRPSFRSWMAHLAK